jgi:surfactin synthase thioesterase subunit
MYRRWPQSIGSVEICPLQFPGRENRTREPHFGTYEELADQLAEVLAPHLDRPYAFFGHCGGVLPGFETTLRLLERGLPSPLWFFVSSQVAPHEGPYGRFLQLSQSELAVEVRRLLTTLGGQPPMPELVDLCLPVLVADVEANKRYHKPAPIRLPCPITVFGWSDDMEIRSELMTGWRDCGEARFRLLEGEHYSFLAAPEHLMAAMLRDMESGLASR